MRIRQQAPATKLWSMCEINSFLSAGGARCSIRIQWSEYAVTYAAPTIGNPPPFQFFQRVELPPEMKAKKRGTMKIVSLFLSCRTTVDF